MRFATAATFWILAIIVSAAFDEPVAQFMRDRGYEAFIERDHDLRNFLKIPGELPALFVCAIAIGVLHRSRWWGAAFVLASAGVSTVNYLIKWIVGRHRPFTWLRDTTEDLRPFDFAFFRGGWEGLLIPANLAFPSGHAALAFALASALTMLCPRGRWVFYPTATLATFERVWENAHWVSDSVAGAAIGVAGVHFVCFVSNRMGLGERSSMQKTADNSNPVFPATAGPVIVEVAPARGALELPWLSMVIPAYNEQENIPTLLSRVGGALASLGKPFEVIIVDDGSTDSSPRLLDEGLRQYAWLRVLRMARNGGQSAAFEAGFEAARGQVIATIDADLQNDPEEVARLLPMLDEKCVDMISGWRKDRQDTPFRKWQSRQANRIRNWISQETVNDSASSLKVYRAHAVKGLRLFNGAHRFLPTLVKLRGYTCFETPVRHSQRFAGTAKYGFRNRAVRAFIDLLGVRWMKTRFLTYQAREVTAGAAPSSSRE